MYNSKGILTRTDEVATIDYYGTPVTVHFEVDDDIISVYKAEIGGVDATELFQVLYTKSLGGPIREATDDLERVVSEQWSQDLAGALMDKARDDYEERMAAE